MTLNNIFFINIFLLLILFNQYLSSPFIDKNILNNKLIFNRSFKTNNELLNEKINFDTIKSAMDNKRQRRSTSFADNNSKIKEYDVKIESECKINTMYLQLEDLNWQNYVIAPKGFDFNYCEGKCINNSKCCEPLQFKPIPIIIKEEDNTKLKIFDNLLVTKCGLK